MSTPKFFHGTTADLAPGDILWNGRAIGRQNHARIDHVYLTMVVEDYAGPEHGTEYEPTGAHTDNYCNAQDVVRTETFYNALTEKTEQYEVHGEGIRGTEDYAIGAALFWAIVGGKIQSGHKAWKNVGPFFVYEVEPLGPIERDDYPELGPEIQKTTCPVRVVRKVSESDIERVLPHVVNADDWNRGQHAPEPEPEPEPPLTIDDLDALLGI